MTTLQQKPEADAIRIGMLAGLFNREEAIQWADLVIADTDKPCSEVLDLSMGDSLDGSSVAALLTAMPGAADAAFTKKLLLSKVKARLAKNQDVGSASAALRQLMDLVPFTDAEKAAINGLKDVAGAEAFLAAYAVPADQTRFTL